LIEDALLEGLGLATRDGDDSQLGTFAPFELLLLKTTHPSLCTVRQKNGSSAIRVNGSEKLLV
jgi:hypothetical protein